MMFDDLDDDDVWSIPPVPSGCVLLFDHLASSTRHTPAWWRRSETEFWMTDFPDFSSMMDRARYMITEMAKPVLDRLQACADDPVLRRSDDSRVSLNELLAEIDELELGALLNPRN